MSGLGSTRTLKLRLILRVRLDLVKKNFEALHRNSAKRYGDSADEIFAGAEAYNASMEALSRIPRLMQFL